MPLLCTLFRLNWAIVPVRKKALKDGQNLNHFLQDARAHQRAKKQASEIATNDNDSERSNVHEVKNNHPRRPRSKNRFGNNICHRSNSSSKLKCF